MESIDMKTSAPLQPLPRAQEQFVLRLPPGLRDRVKHSADANRRSMNAEFVLHIENGLTQQSAILKGSS